MSAPTCSASVSGVAKRAPGTSGSNAARFAGWPVTESAPSVRPWNEPSSATTSVAAGRLARPLERGLDRLCARVAEERLRAAEAVGELRGELLHRLGPVEVRDVPEPVELRVRGRERRGVAVSEPDDGDAGEQVEVALAVGVDEPRAVARGERDVEPRVGRQHLRACVSACVMRRPPCGRSSR